MAVPKNRLSQTRRKRRRANWKLTAPGFVECPQCHEAVMPHHVCPRRKRSLTYRLGIFMDTGDCKSCTFVMCTSYSPLFSL